jgi:hypothetical protein
MGRLHHLRRTLPLALRQGDLGYCLVDYACPDRCGEWTAGRYADQAAAGRLAVESIPRATVFNKPRAYNRGAARAVQAGARALLFLDADTRIEPGLGRWVRGRLRRGRFLVAGRLGGAWYVRGTGGVLGVSAGDFERAGGFDERFEGWGAEDVEMRLKLHLKLGLPFGEIPVQFFRPIDHDDRLRTRFYRVKDRLVSYAANRRRLERKVRAWVGAGLAALPAGAGRLDLLPGRYWLRDGLLLR